MAPEPEETVQAEPETSTAPEAPKEAPDDSDVVWEDDEPTESNTEEAPDAEDADDEELQKIEDRNTWMHKRLAPTKAKLSKAEEELAKVRAELDAYKNQTSNPQAAPIDNTINDIDAYVDNVLKQDATIAKLQADFAELEQKDGVTNGELVRAAAKLESRKELLEAHVRNTIQSQQQVIIDSEAKIASDYKKAVLSKTEEYPNIQKALNRVEANAANLSLDIRRAMILDESGNGINEYASDLVNIIGNDKKAMAYLTAQSKVASKTGRTPVAALEYIGRLKAKIELGKSDAMKAPDEDEVPARRPSIPKAIRPAASSSTKTDDLSVWAREAIRKGERPW